MAPLLSVLPPPYSTKRLTKAGRLHCSLVSIFVNRTMMKAVSRFAFRLLILFFCQFRAEKKELKATTAADKALLHKASLDMSLVPESPEDKKLAALIKYQDSHPGSEYCTPSITATCNIQVTSVGVSNHDSSCYNKVASQSSFYLMHPRSIHCEMVVDMVALAW